MNLIAQTVADGLVLGGIYALAAVGFSLIFGVLHVINRATASSCSWALISR
jgi:branched-chain amino acid transport system permease protein